MLMPPPRGLALPPTGNHGSAPVSDSLRVILVVAFGFSPKILGRGGDLRMVLLLLFECSLSKWEHSNTTCCKKFFKMFANAQAAGAQKFQPKALAPKSELRCSMSHLVEFSLPYFYRTQMKFGAR